MFLGGLLQRINRLLGIEDEYDEYEYVEEDSASTDEHRGRGKLVNLNSNRHVKLAIVEPRSYDEVQRIADELKMRNAVIMNLKNTDTAVSKRIIDFVSGLVYGVDGDLQKICEGVFLVTPSNIRISHNTVRSANRASTGIQEG